MLQKNKKVSFRSLDFAISYAASDVQYIVMHMKYDYFY